jgi:hypothetical protein
MPIRFTQGFFPFPILTAAQVASCNAFAADVDPWAVKVTGIPLATLTKIWWLAKSYAWTVALNGTQASSGRVEQSWTLAGSGKVLVNDISNGTSGLSAPLAAGARVAYIGSPYWPVSGAQIALPTDGIFVDGSGALISSPVATATVTPSEPGFPTTPYTVDVPLQETTSYETGPDTIGYVSRNLWQFFRKMVVETDGATPPSYSVWAAVDSSGAAGFAPTVLGNFYTYRDPSTLPSYHASGADLIIQADGATIATIPLYYIGGIGTAPSYTFGGSITLNFDDFFD